MSDFKDLKRLCKGQCPITLRTVILGVEESIEECDGTTNNNITELVLTSLADDSLQSELSENLEEFWVWEGDNLEDVVSCINEGAVFGKVPESSGLTDDSTLLDLVIYSLEVSL